MLKSVVLALAMAYVLSACAGPPMSEYFKQQEQIQSKPTEKKPVFGS